MKYEETGESYIMSSFIVSTSSVYIDTLRRIQYFGRLKKVEIAFIKKLRAVLIDGIPDTTGYRTSSCLLLKNTRIKIYRNIILSAL